MAKLTPEEVITMTILHDKGESKAAISRTLGVTEGAIRYRLKRRGVSDGRVKPAQADRFAPVIAAFMTQTADAPRERNLAALHEDLRELGYPASYGRLARWVRRHYPPAPVRPFRRVETPAGAQAQADWQEDRVYLEDHGGVVAVHAFHLKLSHSRALAVVWSLKEDMAAWLHCHNEGYRRLGGIPAIERIDNLKTGVSSGSGPKAVINPVFKAYAREMGFHVEAARAYTPTDKGKVERGVLTQRGLGLTGPFRDLAHFQAESDLKVTRLMARLKCPATGKTVAQSLEDERLLLRPLPETLPAAFTQVVTRTVEKDCTLRFLGKQFSVPFIYSGRQVEVRDGIDGRVRIVADGKVVAEHSAQGAAPLVINPIHYEGKGNDRVIPPTPLGRTGKRLADLMAAGVQLRSVEIYAKLAEVLSCAQ